MKMLAERFRKEQTPIQPIVFEPEIHGSAELRAMMAIPKDKLDNHGKVIVQRLLECEEEMHPWPILADDYLTLHGVPTEDDWHDQLDPRKEIKT
jgi:hypothetical protein